MSALANVEPKEVFRFFEEISQIPRGSGNTRKISDYLVKFAQERGLECYRDDLCNVITFLLVKSPITYHQKDKRK